MKGLFKFLGLAVGALVLLLVLFVAVSMISSNLLRGYRFDLTENRLFTLSEGTVNILENLAEPVTLYFYFSQRPAASCRRCGHMPGGSTSCSTSSSATPTAG